MTGADGVVLCDFCGAGPDAYDVAVSGTKNPAAHVCDRCARLVVAALAKVAQERVATASEEEATVSQLERSLAAGGEVRP